MADSASDHAPRRLIDLMRSRIFLILSAVAFLATVAIARVKLVYRWQLAPVVRAHHIIQAKHLALFQSDMKTLRENLRFPQVTVGHSDAGPFLNPHVSWLPRRQAHQPEVIIVPDAVRSELVRYGRSYLEHPSHFATFHTNLSFFSQLDAYDYWDIEHTSPIAELIKAHRFVPPAELPVPDPLDLIASAKLRLIEGQAEADDEERKDAHARRREARLAGKNTVPEGPEHSDASIVQALRDVRELSRLLLTTENSQLITGGLAILEEERHAYHFYVRRKKLRRGDWTPISGAMLTKARRTFDATEGYLHVWTEPAVFATVFLKGELPLGICSALNDALPATMTLRAYMEPQLPFEQDYRNGYHAIDATLTRAKPECRMYYLSQLLKEDNFPLHLPGLRLLNGAPYWRKLFALRAELANFSNFDAYEKLGVVSHQVLDNLDATTSSSDAPADE